MGMPRAPISVCAAIVVHNGRLLLATRRPGSHCEGLWEFPGGKCNEGETLEACIVREIQEELSLHIHVTGEYCVLQHNYPGKTILLHFMLCRLADSNAQVTPMEGQKCGWFQPMQWDSLSFTPADRDFLDAHRNCIEELCIKSLY